MFTSGFLPRLSAQKCLFSVPTKLFRWEIVPLTVTAGKLFREDKFPAVRHFRSFEAAVQESLVAQASRLHCASETAAPYNQMLSLDNR